MAKSLFRVLRGKTRLNRRSKRDTGIPAYDQSLWAYVNRRDAMEREPLIKRIFKRLQRLGL